jgi:hypothetical protein
MIPFIRRIHCQPAMHDNHLFTSGHSRSNHRACIHPAPPLPPPSDKCRSPKPSKPRDDARALAAATVFWLPSVVAAPVFAAPLVAVGVLLRALLVVAQATGA